MDVWRLSLTPTQKGEGEGAKVFPSMENHFRTPPATLAAIIPLNCRRNILMYCSPRRSRWELAAKRAQQVAESVGGGGWQLFS